MKSTGTYDVVIIGGGIVGAATAYTLTRQRSLSVLLIEAENRLSAHQTGHNSGVIHSGLYYKPGSLKAKNCTDGREQLYDFCDRYDIPYERCGKIVVAATEEEIPMLRTLEERGRANGLAGLQRLTADEIKEFEPFAAGVAGLHVPQTGIVDFPAVVDVYARLFRERGGEIRTSTRFLSMVHDGNDLVLETTQGEFRTGMLVNCGGLRSDEIARTCGMHPGIRIIPFRGEYYELRKEKEYLVKNLIYPVPDPRFPFLGVHFTRMVTGGIEAGPNAVLAYKKEGYSKTDISLVDLFSMASFPGFWKMARQHYKMGFEEIKRSYSKALFVRALQKLIPHITEDDVHPSGSGVRAQALDAGGKLLDDFYIMESKNMVHVLNAPSPAATSSLSIGSAITEKIIQRLGN
ncbi:MAG: L-2-hydroxyglutarate oxidase [Bacteroidota bacterium]|jgi:L-2-hydroxyglutarate oxidase